MSAARRCAVDGCRNGVQHYREGLCDSHYRHQQLQILRTREQRGIRETGLARVRDEGEVELTDGHMCWWVTAAFWERKGLFVKGLR